MTDIKGLTTRRTSSGIQVVRVHYSADPDRDSEWAAQERRKYSSQPAWDREQEIVHDAGGGEPVFAEILNRYADKIIIRDPSFQIPPHWIRIGRSLATRIAQFDAKQKINSEPVSYRSTWPPVDLDN
jgi:hypothetical protein